MSLEKIVSSVSAEQPMYYDSASQLADNMGYLAHPVYGKMVYAMTGLSFVLSTLAFTYSCRNYRMLALVKTAEALDFLKHPLTTTSPTADHSILDAELHSLIKLLMTIFIIMLVLGLLIAVGCVSRRIYLINSTRRLCRLPVHTSLFVAMYGNGQVYMQKLTITPLQLRDVVVFDLKEFIKPVLVSAMCRVRGTIHFDWSFIKIKKRGSANGNIMLPSKFVISAFEIRKLESVLNNLETFRIVAVMDTSYYEVFSWNQICEQVQPTGSTDTHGKPRCVYDNPMMSRPGDLDSA